MPTPKDRWPTVRRWLLGAAAVIAIGLAAAGVLVGRPLFAVAAWTFALLPVVYLIVAAVRGGFPRAAGSGIAAGLVLVVSASTLITLISCGQRLEPQADLSGCDLTDLELAGLDLSRSDLTDANLSGANLARTNFDGSDLSRADLQGASMDRTSLEGTKLDGADLRNVDLTKAVFSPTSLVGTVLDGANLGDVELVSIPLRNASLRGVNLRAANLSSSDLSGASLDAATLDDATLVGVIGLTDEALAQALGVPFESLGGALTERAVRLEPRPDILSGLAGACGGGGMPEASAYPQGDFHPMVILTDTGQVGTETDRASELGWEPMALRFAQLVACVQEQENTEVEHCPYTLQGGGGAASITRIRHSRTIRVVEAATGKTVLDRDFEGSNPESCPLFHTFSNFDQNVTFEGSTIGFNKFQGDLARLVQ